jgi:hypothetical protein
VRTEATARPAAHIRGLSFIGLYFSSFFRLPLDYTDTMSTLDIGLVIMFWTRQDSQKSEILRCTNSSKGNGLRLKRDAPIFDTRSFTVP